MFKNLLVPLDGSRLAEAALPAASSLAENLGARVTLVHVIERDAPQEVHGERHLMDPDEAGKYLEKIAARAFPPKIQVEKHVHTSEVSSVAGSIAEHITELQSDLIIMCTHGRGGPKRWIFGRIAQQVVSLEKTPVLLVRPSGAKGKVEFSCRRLLVTLDGNSEHEHALSVAAKLARPCGAELYLIMAVHTLATLSGQDAATARMLPGTTAAVLDFEEKDATEYLNRHVMRLQTKGITAGFAVERGKPVDIIMETAERIGADVIVLATHGKTGIEAFWAGSTTPNVAGRSLIPILLVPVWRNERQT